MHRRISYPDDDADTAIVGCLRDRRRHRPSTFWWALNPLGAVQRERYGEHHAPHLKILVRRYWNTSVMLHPASTQPASSLSESPPTVFEPPLQFLPYPRRSWSVSS